MQRQIQIARWGMATLAAAISAQLHAQTPGLEEIIVTAQKRAETAQEIPIAIDVIGADTFIREGVRDIKDIGKMSTELEINSNSGQATVIGIRGMQQQGFAPTGDTLAAVHMDGAFLSSFWGLNGLMYDLERVEVLAGPQGTLYGRNSAAGALNLITKRPGRDFEGNGMVEYGSEGTVRLGGGISVPMSDTFSMRLAGQKYTRDALFTDGGGEQDQWGARLSAVWSPTDRDELFFTYDYTLFDGTNDPTTLYAINTDARLTNGSVPTSVTSYLGSPTLSDPYDNLPYESQQGLEFVGQNEQTNWGVMAQYSHSFGGFDASLQYSHRKLDGVSRNPTKSLTAYSGNLLPNTVTSDTAELRFTSTGTGAFEWVTGLFYTEAENLGWNAAPNSPLATAPTTPGNAGPDPITGIDIDWCPCSGGFFPNSGSMYSYAIFGQTTWTPASNERLHLTGGLRYTFDWKDAFLGFWATTNTGAQPIFAFGIPDMPPEVQAIFAGVPDFANGDNDRTWDAVQWKLGVEYEITEEAMVYGSVATGYKSGGLTYGPTPELEPEELLAYEIGFKSRFLNNTLQWNGSAWWYDYTDIEVGATRQLGFTFINAQNQPQDTAPSTANVGAVDMAGVSSDIDWLFTENDQLGFSFTYVYSKIKDGTETSPAGITSQIFIEGERLGDAPKWQMLGRYSHTFNFANGATLNPALKYQWQSKKYDGDDVRTNLVQYPTGRNWTNQTIPSRGILDLSMRFAPGSDRWDVTAYVNNATDELNIRTLSYQQNQASPTYGHITATLGEPRTYGVILNARF